MLTLKLWRALRHPPRHHPVFQYMLAHTRSGTPRPTSAFFLWMFACSGFGFCWTFVFEWIPAFLLLALLFFNTTYSAYWAMHVSRTIAQESASRRYDLLAALPLGRFGTSWAMSMGTLHSRQTFFWIPFAVRMISVVMFFTLVAALLLTLLVLSNQQASPGYIRGNLDVLALVLLGFGLVIAFYIDHVYSVITALLFGIAGAVDVQNAAEATLRATAGFLLVQALTYVVCVLCVLVVLPALFDVAGWQGTQASLLVEACGLGLFILLREFTLRGLWRYLTHQLNADNDMEVILATHR